ncbi:MAG TPA: hypothetical protein VIZ65_02830 [Cellvibrionaceae bacterium]
MRVVALVAGGLTFFAAVSYFLHERATGDVKPANQMTTAVFNASDELKKKLI